MGHDVPCQANRVDHWAQPNGLCRAWHDGPEVRLGHGPVWTLGQHCR
jgi:hypothetical protein